MNDLSLVIIAIHFLTSLKTLLVTLGLLGGLLVIFQVFYVTVYNDDWEVRRGEKPKLDYSHKGLIPIILITTFGILLPPEETLIMIAASEAADMAIQSETGQLLLNELNSRLSELVEKD